MSMSFFVCAITLLWIVASKPLPLQPQDHVPRTEHARIEMEPPRRQNVSQAIPLLIQAQATTTAKTCPMEKGYCVLANGQDQNGGVAKLDNVDGNTAQQQASCLAKCQQHTGATGCEVIWNQWNRGCYVHTSSIARGNGVGQHMCWVFSKCSVTDAPAAAPDTVYYEERTNGQCDGACRYIESVVECESAAKILRWDMLVAGEILRTDLPAQSYSKDSELHGCFLQSNGALRVNIGKENEVDCSPHKCACKCQKDYCIPLGQPCKRRDYSCCSGSKCSQAYGICIIN